MSSSTAALPEQRSGSFSALVPVLLPVLLLWACSAPEARSDAGVTPGSAEADHHPVLAPSYVVDLGPGKPGLARGTTNADGAVPVTRVPVGGTVFFRNVDPEHFVQLALSGDFASCAGCVSVTNFACLQSGALAAAIEPGGISTLCFHKPGRYPLLLTGGAEPLSGYLEVFEPQRGRPDGGGR